MARFKLGTEVTVPVYMTRSDTGLPVSGLDASGITCGVLKPDGAVVAVPVTGANWSEVTTPPFGNAGMYRLKLPANVHDQDGNYLFLVKTAMLSTTDQFPGSYEIVLFNDAEIQDSLSRCLGLMLQNAVQDAMIYEGPNLTDARIRVYADGDGAASQDAGKLVRTYQMHAEFNEQGNLTLFRIME